jgi:hypothetical protein
MVYIFYLWAEPSVSLWYLIEQTHSAALSWIELSRRLVELASYEAKGLIELMFKCLKS